MRQAILYQNLMIDQINQANIDKYFNFFTNQQRKKAQINFHQFQNSQRLQRRGVIYRESSASSAEISLSIVKESINSEVLVLQAEWGKFTVILNVLNVAGANHFKQTKGMSGSYGNVYQTSVMREEFAVKCLCFAKQKMVGAALSMAIKETMLLKILAALEIGPYFSHYMGFDLIVYEDSVQFAMEKCLKVSSISNEQLHSLKKDLLIMHKYSIIHYDIKPENIMFSPTFKKVVFIDFGLSSIINADHGQSLQIGFRGTLDYCSNQMKNCFESNKPQLVDVYYNDIHCLVHTLISIKVNSSIIEEQICPFDEDMLQDNKNQGLQLSLLYLIKYYLYFNKFKEVDSIFSKLHYEINQTFGLEILYFLYEMKPSADLMIFYQIWLTTYKRDGIEFAELNSIYSSNNYCFKIFKYQEEKKKMFQSYDLIVRLTKNPEIKSLGLERQCIRELLLAKKKNINIVSYFRLYLDYISFNNNIHDVGMKQRVEITKFLYKIDYFEEKQYSEDQYERINQTFVLIIHKLLNVEFVIKMKKIIQIKELIFDLVEHIFILNQFSLEEYLSLLDSIKNSDILDYQAKIEFILKVKHSNTWLLIRISSDKNNPNYIHQQIQIWVYQSANTLQSCNEQYLCWIVAYLNICWKEQMYCLRQITQLTEAMQTISRNLRQLFVFQILTLNLIFSRKSEKNFHIVELYKCINYREKQKIFFFMFYIYQIYETQFKDFEKVVKMQKMIIKTIKSPQIFDTLLMKTTIYFMKHTNNIDFLVNFHEFVGKLNFLSFNIHHFIVFTGINRLKQILTTTEEQKELFRKIMEKLGPFMQVFQLKKYVETNLAKDDSKHFCTARFDYSSFIFMRYCYYNMSGSIIDYISERNILISSIQSLKCLKCKQIIEKLCEFQFQRYLMGQIKTQRSSKLQSYLFQSCQRLIELTMNFKQLYQSKYFDRITHYNMAVICSLDSQYEELHHGLLRFYLFLKENKQLINYLYNHQDKISLITPTLNQIIKRNSMQEAVFMLTSFTAQLTITDFSSYLGIIFNQFRRFVQSNQKIDFSELFCILNRYHHLQNGRVNYYNSVYYLLILKRLPLRYIRKCAYLFCKNLPHIDRNISQYLEAYFIRIVLFQNHSVGYHINFKSFQARQTDFFMKKIVKLYKMLSLKATSKIYNNKIVSKCRRLLAQKALRLGGPYDIGLLGYEKTYVKIKNAKKSQPMSVKQYKK